MDVVPSPINSIHPTAIVEPSVSMGSGNVIGPYSVLLGDVRLGSDNWIGPHVVIGTPPEHRGARARGSKGPYGKVVIGNRNFIHEFATVQSPTESTTAIGDDCFIMNKSHVAHDCTVGNRVTMAPTAVLGGHSTVETEANLGLGVLVHQWRTVSELSMLGMGAVVTRDLPPFVTAMGMPARTSRLNRVGLDRAGLKGDYMDALEEFLVSGVSIDESQLPPRVADAINRWRQRLST